MIDICNETAESAQIFRDGLGDVCGVDHEHAVFRSHEFRRDGRVDRSCFSFGFQVRASAFVVQHREHLIQRRLIILRSPGDINFRNCFDQRLVPINVAIRKVRMKVLHGSPHLRQPNEPGDARVFY